MSHGLPRLTRRSDGAVFRIVLQARSPNGPVSLLGDDGPPFERVETTNDRLLVDFTDVRSAAPSPPPPDADLARAAFEAYGASTGGKTWDGKPIPSFDVIRENTPHAAAAWEAAAIAVLTKLGRSPR